MTVSKAGGAGEAPKGYTGVTLYNTETKESKTFFIPIGQKIHFNGKTYDPSKGKNNQIVITGTSKQDKFNMMGLALEHMDVNDDGLIDVNDTSYDGMARSINKQLQKSGSKFWVKDLPDVYSDAGVYEGQGGVVFQKGQAGNPEKIFEFRIDKDNY